jgi:hypothetical protein
VQDRRVERQRPIRIVERHTGIGTRAAREMLVESGGNEQL